MFKVPAPEFTGKSISTEFDGLVIGMSVTLQLHAAKECHCERSEAIRWLRGFFPANHHDLSVTTEDENTFLKGTMASSIKENL